VRRSGPYPAPGCTNTSFAKAAIRFFERLANRLHRNTGDDSALDQLIGQQLETPFGFAVVQLVVLQLGTHLVCPGFKPIDRIEQPSRYLPLVKLDPFEHIDVLRPQAADGAQLKLQFTHLVAGPVLHLEDAL